VLKKSHQKLLFFRRILCNDVAGIPHQENLGFKLRAQKIEE